jgi:hypothetical protein
MDVSKKYGRRCRPIVWKSKQIVSKLLNHSGNDRIGIVAYAGSAFPVLPITSDYGVARCSCRV